MNVKSEDTPIYVLDDHQPGDDIIAEALSILTTRLMLSEDLIQSPEDSKKFLILKLAQQEYETFNILFLTNQHQVIEFTEMFRGTIDSCSVHPREVIKKALELNACAVILAHNHPSGKAKQSHADEVITQRLKEGLEMVNVRILDHIIIGGTNTLSFAEKGLL